jgi:hypothetical protein
MKKVLVAIVALFCSVSSFAQYSSGGFSLDEENLYWGVRFGLTSATLGGDLDLGAKTGMTLAGVVGLRASDSTPVFIESGLYYTERGAKSGHSKLGEIKQVGYNNLEVPILVKYGIKATDEIAVLPFFGPYFSYAFNGKTKQVEVDGTKSVGSFDEKRAYTGGLKRANMGFKLGCGAEYNKVYLEVGYQFGITNVCKEDEWSSHSNALFVNFGVNF